MRRTTALMSEWQAEAKTGERLRFNNCKGGYFSTIDNYGLKVIGKTSQSGTPDPENPIPINCVKQGTKITCCGKNLFGIEQFKAKAIEYGCPSTNEYVEWQAAKVGNKVIVDGIFKPNTRYTIMFRGYNATPSAARITNFIVKYTNGTIDQWGHPFNPNSAKTVFVTQAGRTVESVMGQWQSGDARFYTDFFGVFEGNLTAEDYEPYNGSEITVPCDLYEGDIWYPMTGKVERHTCHYIVTGIENVYKVMQSDITFYIGKPNKNNAISGNGMTGAIAGTRFNGSNLSIFDVVYFNFPGIDNINAAKNLIGQWYDEGNPFEIVYPISSPVLEQYTPQPISAPQGTVNVIQQPTDLTAELSATMLTRR